MASENTITTEQLHFEVGAGVIFTLGRDLITDPVQAVMELVKNAYDADSSWVMVDINTTSVCDDPNCRGAVGFVRVLDSGHGMSLDDVKQGWLTIAQSRKRRMKAEGKRTRTKSRIPMGDKGLGRLGAQALGRYIQIVTRAEGASDELTVWIDWAAFHEDAILSAVEVKCFSRPRDAADADGTSVTVLGLHTPETWSSITAKQNLQRQLARLISPFKGIKDFRIQVAVDGTTLDLLDLARTVRMSAASTFTFVFDGEKLEMEGEAKLAYCRPTPSRRAERELMAARFAAHVSGDGGEKLLQTLARRAVGRRSNDMAIEKSGRQGWFIKGAATRTLDSIDKHERKGGRPVSPGPFEGELDTFVFSGHSGLAVSDEIKYIVRYLTGVRVYRNGFGILLDDDWLKLAKHITRGSSFFELKLENTVGYIDISVENNAQLTETADRQRFQTDSSAYRNFSLLVGEVVRFVGEFHELVRRGTVDFLNEEAKRSVGVDPNDSIAQVGTQLDKFVLDASRVKSVISRQVAELGEIRKQLHVAVSESAPRSGKGPSEPSVVDPLGDELARILPSVDRALGRTQDDLGVVNDLLARANEIAELRNVLSERIDALHEQAILLHETASLGLGAEVVAHEIAHIADGLLSRATPLLNTLLAERASPKLIGFVEHVRSQSAALRLQAAHVAPALRYVRERRDNLDVASVIRGLIEYHGPRLRRQRIRLTMESAGQDGFSVYMNQGKLTQVADNLILNAEYWAAEDLRHGMAVEGFVKITLDRPFIRITDSGLGVDPAVETLMFEQPFVTRKKDGRGLGLFISRRLLESDGCSISLTSDRNKVGRRNTFEIDLSGVLRDGT